MSAVRSDAGGPTSEMMAPSSSPVGGAVRDGTAEQTTSSHRRGGVDGRRDGGGGGSQIAAATNTTTIDASSRAAGGGNNSTSSLSLDEVKRFELFRSVIQHEDDLLNQRVSWIILAQSFLVAAFITKPSDDGGEGDVMRLITAIVGLSTVVVTMPAILAAGRNIELQQRVYFSGIVSEERCFTLHGHGRGMPKSSGQMVEYVSMEEEQRKRLSEGHILPNMSFRGRGTVPILFTVVGLSTVQVLGWLFLLIALLRDW